MRKIEQLVTQYEAATIEFPDGRFKNNTSGDNGSAVVAETQTDAYYAFRQFIEKYLPNGLSGRAESADISDFLDAFEYSTSRKNEYVPIWASARSYVSGDNAMIYGCQWVCIEANTGKNPLDNPSFWVCVSGNELVKLSSDVAVVSGASGELHDINSAKYKTLFSLGTHILQDSKTRADIKAYGLHLDGALYTGNVDMNRLVNAFVRKDAFTTGNNLKDFKNRVLRAVGADSGAVGGLLEDAFQGHRHVIRKRVSTGAAGVAAWYSIDIEDLDTVNYSGNTGMSVLDPRNDGVNGIPRISSETRAKSATVGVPYVVLIERIA